MNEKFSPEFIKDMRALYAKASKHPAALRKPVVCGGGGIVNLYGPYPLDDAYVIADYQFIAANEFPTALDEIEVLRAENARLRDENTDNQRELLARYQILNRAVEHRARLFPDDLGNGWIDSIDKLAGEVERLREVLATYADQTNWMLGGESDCGFSYSPSFLCEDDSKPWKIAVDALKGEEE